MKAEIIYTIKFLERPFLDNHSVEKGWCLVKITRPEYGDEEHEPVAVFNLDSEAGKFMGHLYACQQQDMHPIIIGEDCVANIKEFGKVIV